MQSTREVTGLVLAGGYGRRMGHRDKGLVHWRGQPLVASVCNRLRPQVGDIIINCNRNLSRYRNYADLVVKDDRPGFQGPLAGLEASRRHLQTEYVVLAACDYPRLPEDLVARLLRPFSRANSPDISYAHDGTREQFLCAIIKTTCLATLPDFLDDGRRAVKDWYRANSCAAVDFSDCADNFRNYNSSLDLSD